MGYSNSTKLYKSQMTGGSGSREAIIRRDLQRTPFSFTMDAGKMQQLKKQ